jgi:hypothetical protein
MIGEIRPRFKYCCARIRSGSDALAAGRAGVGTRPGVKPAFAANGGYPPVDLYISSQPADIILQAPPRGPEGVTNAHVNVLMRSAGFKTLHPFLRLIIAEEHTVETRHALNHNLFLWQPDLYHNMKLRAEFVVPVWRFNNDMATRYARKVAVQLRRFGPDPSGDEL